MSQQQVAIDQGTFINGLQARVLRLEQQMDSNIRATTATILPGDLAAFADATGTMILDSGISLRSVENNALSLIGAEDEVEPIAPAGQRDLWSGVATGVNVGFFAYSPDFGIIWASHAPTGLDYSTDGGHTFTACTFDIAPTAFLTVGARAGLAVAVSVVGETFYSTNGIDFTKSGDGLITGLFSNNMGYLPSAGLFTYSDGAGPAPCFSYSADGKSWTATSSTTIMYPDAFATNGTIMVAVGSTASPWTAYSLDGKTWTNTPTPLASATSAVAWSHEKQQFMAVAINGQSYTSADGISWTATAANPTITGISSALIWVGNNGYNRWYLGASDAYGNFSLWSTPDATIPFVGTALDGAVKVPGDSSSLVYYPPNDSFVVGTTSTPSIAYSIPRAYDLKALSDNIRVRGMPAIDARYSTYGTFIGPNSTTTETTISTPTTPSQILGSLMFQAAQPLGMEIDIDLNLSVTSAAGDTLTIRYYTGNGPTVLLSQAIVVPASGSAQSINSCARMTVQASNLQVNGTATVSGQSPVITTNHPAYTRTLGNTLSITAQWGAGASSCTMTQLTISSLFPNGA